MNVNDLTVQLLVAECKRLEKALELACKELETHPYSQWNNSDWQQYFIQKAREEE